jgi:hypothetical protein
MKRLRFLSSIIFMLGVGLNACGAPNALPNRPVLLENTAPETSSQTENKTLLNFPFQAYKTAYLGFYPDDQLIFQIYKLRANGSPEDLPVFEQKVTPTQLPEQLRFSVPLQIGQNYYYSLTLISKQMPCSGPVLNGQLKPSTPNQSYELESPQLEVNADLRGSVSIDETRPISGFIRNYQGEPVSGVEVQMTNTFIGFEQLLKTDSRGYFVWGTSPLSTEVTITARPTGAEPIVKTLVARRLDDTGAKRGVCDPSLNRLELVLTN